MIQQHYILRWKGSSLQKDEFLSASENTVRIGQKADCELRLPNNGPYADELFAVVKPTRNEDGWQLIPTSEFVPSYVNGIPVEMTHFLHSGDRISFGGYAQELTFEVRRGKAQQGNQTLRYSGLSKRFLTVLSSAAAIVVLLVISLVIGPVLENAANEKALKQAESSVLTIETEALFYVCITPSGTDTLRRAIPAIGNSLVTRGAAFLTSSGMLVTARHCIEPWLNFKQIFRPETFPEAVAWALEAETYNQTHQGDTLHRVVSLCSVSGEGIPLRRFFSSEFHYTCSRDEIVETGDFDNNYYWRSISGRFNRSDMMLDDVAVLPDFGRKGHIHLATEPQMKRWATNNTSLLFMGYPSRLQDGLETRQGRLVKFFVPNHMLAHDGGLDPGFSGGPALLARHGKAYALGIISTLDQGSNHCIYSVPVTEISNCLQP